MTHIPLDHPTIERIKALVPAEAHARTWVAGSAATHWGQNGDVDAWVLMPSWSDAQRIRRELQRVPVTADEAPTETYAAGSTMLYASDGLHLLASGYPAISDVVEGFDITCHAQAVNIVTGEVYVPPWYTELVRIHTWRDARRTLLRGMKFALRYTDESFWHDDMTCQCAVEVFDMRLLTHDQYRLWRRIAVSDGL